MKAKLLRRIRKNWFIGLEKGDKLFPSRIAVGKCIHTCSYEYSWAYRYEFLKLLLGFSGLGLIRREIVYRNYLSQHFKRRNKKFKKRGIEKKIELLYKIA